MIVTWRIYISILCYRWPPQKKNCLFCAFSSTTTLAWWWQAVEREESQTDRRRAQATTTPCILLMIFGECISFPARSQQVSHYLHCSQFLSFLSPLSFPYSSILVRRTRDGQGSRDIFPFLPRIGHVSFKTQNRGFKTHPGRGHRNAPEFLDCFSSCSSCLFLTFQIPRWWFHIDDLWEDRSRSSGYLAWESGLDYWRFERYRWIFGLWAGQIWL